MLKKAPEAGARKKSVRFFGSSPFGGLVPLFVLEARFEPVAVSFYIYYVDAMCQAIEQGAGQSFVSGEGGGPVGKGEIRGDDQARLLVALAEETEQMLRSRLVHGNVAQLVDHHGVKTAEARLEAKHLAFLPRFPVEIGQPGSGEESDPVAKPTRLTGQRNCQVTFSSSWGA